MKEKQSKICIPMNWHIAMDVKKIIQMVIS